MQGYTSGNDLYQVANSVALRNDAHVQASYSQYCAPRAQDVAQLASVRQEFCSSYISYVPPTSTTIVLSTPAVSTSVVISVEHSTVVYNSVVTVTAANKKKRDDDGPLPETAYIEASPSLSVSTIPTGAVKRAAISTPTLVAHWPAQKISAACSLIATGSAYSTITSNGAMQVVTTTTTVDSIIYSLSTTTTSATVSAPKSCPTQVVINGGFEDGTTTPFVFSEGPNFFNDSSGRLDLLDDATLAHSGSYLASVVETDASLGGLNFRLSQTVPVCPGASYTLNFYASSQSNPILLGPHSAISRLASVMFVPRPIQQWVTGLISLLAFPSQVLTQPRLSFPYTRLESFWVLALSSGAGDLLGSTTSAKH